MGQYEYFKRCIEETNITIAINCIMGILDVEQEESSFPKVSCIITRNLGQM